MGRRGALWFVGLLAVLGATPGGRSFVKSTVMLAEVLPSLGRRGLGRRGLGRRARRRLAPAVHRIELAHGSADLFEAYEGRPDGPRGEGRGAAPGVVLVHGANRDGIDDPRVQALAAAFCRAGRTVLAPDLVLGQRRLDPDDLTRILDAIDALADRTGPVAVVAFSYGGGLALSALAERPSIQARVRAVATVGTYFDLVHLIEGVTTGQVAVDGALHPWQPPTEALQQVGPLLAEFLDAKEAAAIRAALESGNPQSLSPTGQAAYDVIVNKDPRRTEVLVARLPAEIRGMLDRLSPARRISAIRVPVLALHSRVDPAAPAIESAELVRAIRRKARARLTLVGSFNHVTPAARGLSMLRDTPRLVTFGARILRTQERWLPWRQAPSSSPRSTTMSGKA